MPAGVFAMVVQEDAGGATAVFNIEPSYRDRKANFVFEGPCEETLFHAFGLTPDDLPGASRPALHDQTLSNARILHLSRTNEFVTMAGLQATLL